MVVVAVAGGTGSVGRTIVEAIKADGSYEVVVLARNVGTLFHHVFAAHGSQHLLGSEG